MAAKAALLQWGRELLVAESSVGCVSSGGELTASMGPRLVSRGKVADLRESELERLEASMGPRLVSRGKIALATLFAP